MRRPESNALSTFLTEALTGSVGLVIEGEPGIGKTTLWLEAIEQAREQGFDVLSARPAAAESVMAYGSLTDLLSGCDPDDWADLPSPQRIALDRVTLRRRDAGTDQRVVAAAFLAAVTAFAERAPVLIAIDDLQWLDSSSRRIVGYATRRLSGPASFIGTLRTNSGGLETTDWLTMPRPEDLRRLTLAPLTLAGLHTLLAERTGRSYPRPVLTQIFDVTGGNPFYALELARVLADTSITNETPLPATLSELVNARIRDLDGGVRQLLFAAACAAAPTVQLLAALNDGASNDTVAQLEAAEDSRVITIEGDRIRFAHPLLARGVYASATAAQRRSMHRRLAELVTDPEVRARHMALAATYGDPETLESLDEAAVLARARGAPVAAAELVQRAIDLGGDTPARRILLAGHHFNAGDLTRARNLLEELIAVLGAGPTRARAMHLLALVRLGGDSFLDASQLLQAALNEAGDDRELAGEIYLPLSFAMMNVGDLPAAIDAVEHAVAEAETVDNRALLSQALSWLVGLRVMGGDALDTESLDRAMRLEDSHAATPVMFRASMVHALMSGWTGDLEVAHHAIRKIRRRCVERGEESEQMFVAFHSVLIETWRGDFGEAMLIADDTVERAAQLGGDLPLAVALTNRSVALGYTGRVDEARVDAKEAIAASERCGSSRLAEWPIAMLGFIDVSLGAYESAVRSLRPQIARIRAMPRATEVFVGSLIPDAVEAFVNLARLDEAEELTEILQSNGARLERPWMIAVGSRCRSMLQAAQGEIEEATTTAHEAMEAHELVAMPFDRARTRLVLGQLLRRQKHRGSATEALKTAWQEFEALGATVWADRARAELTRTAIPGRGSSMGLTPSEKRVAELASTGKTNRQMATELFVSPKTIEV
ncbi:MAG TPA: AAA family ATPase, partial [Thermomicrobiales bacterium]|nr:AAA family ATPase [Thermomicrobiales bacterium]